jgi:hypothetical protein
MNRVEVFYTDRRNGWAVVFMDPEGNQVGVAVYHYRKSDAKRDALSHDLPVRVYARDGKLMGVL